MSSAEDSPARIYRCLAAALGSTVSDRAYGVSLRDSLASFDPATSSWRTSQRCLVEGWERYSQTWPRSGLMHSGTVSPLAPLVPLTKETGSGLLPTLVRRDARTIKGGQDMPGREGGGSLLQMLLSTGSANGYLNPRWTEWFLGYPQTWTQLPRLETRLSRKSRKSSVGQS